MEDVLIHPAYQKQGIGVRLVKALLGEAEAYGLEIVRLTYDKLLLGWRVYAVCWWSAEKKPISYPGILCAATRLSE
nr:GNAT family N-acetyltransferase [Domibacillus robiginosus]